MKNFARIWGIGLFELVNDNFQFVENSELFSSNRIESMVSLDDNNIAVFSSKLGVVIFDSLNNFRLLNKQQVNKWLRETYIQCIK